MTPGSARAKLYGMRILVAVALVMSVAGVVASRCPPPDSVAFDLIVQNSIDVTTLRQEVAALRRSVAQCRADK